MPRISRSLTMMFAAAGTVFAAGLGMEGVSKYQKYNNLAVEYERVALCKKHNHCPPKTMLAAIPVAFNEKLSEGGRYLMAGGLAFSLLPAARVLTKSKP